MKKIIAIVVVVVMTCALFAACAPAEQTPSASADASASVEASADGSASADANAGGGDNLAKSKEMWTKAVKEAKSTDNQLLMPDPIEKTFPERPADPTALGEDEAGHYYDMEYVGWDAGAKDAKLPKSPGDGSIGKKVIVIVHGDHAWTNANMKGWEMAGDALGMEVEILSPNWDPALQDQLIDQAINAKPDAIALIPLSAENATQQFRKITQAGIPAFGYNTLTTSDAMPYMEAWTGPDDWAQMRDLADTLGEAMGGKGGVAYITHNVGTSPYYARTYGPITQLKEKYPDIATLDVQSPGFEAAKVKQVVADWITRFGDKLNAIFLADDSAQATGAIDAIKESGRTDIKVVAAGNSKTGQDLVKSGDLLSINYQSAEGDAGLAARTIAAWFNGEEVLPVGYLSTAMITKDNVEEFYPTQW